ncbi:MAG: excinuclease ABC subunit UvrC [Betaproteobacteria bacterium]
MNPEPEKRADKPAPFDPREVLKSLPNRPGVYRMLNAAGDTLYVGKARDLKKRVSSYFHKQGHDARIALMISQIGGVETTVVRNEAEALFLENSLIKTHQPRFNILFKDDKSYPYLMITGDPSAQFRFHRGKLEKKHTFFGPFPNAGAVRDGIQMLQKVFQVRTCEASVFNNRSRPCMLFQIERCSAPCVGLISAADYAADVERATMFLNGKTDQLLTELKDQMNAAAEELKFEKAAALRDRIHRLQQLQSRQFVHTSSERDIDVVAVVSNEGLIALNLVMIRGGRHVGDKTLFPQHAEGEQLPEILLAFLAQHYLERSVPTLIVVNHPVESDALSVVLSEQAGRRVEINSNPYGERRVWLTMATQNAELAIAQRLAQKSTQEERLALLIEALGLPADAQRFECFDVSHTMGERAVASCVVFDKLKMQTGEYRRFNVTPPQGGDDYAAMHEALTRRFARIVAGESPIPDLVIIDGGKGQVGIAVQALAEAGLPDVALIGISKGEERKPGLEEIVFPNRSQTLHLPSDHPGLHLLQQIRDEAHRFAISGHRARRQKARTASSLQEIGGIGSKRRQALLAHFGGMRGVQAASVDDLTHVAGISRALAETIYAALH